MGTGKWSSSGEHELSIQAAYLILSRLPGTSTSCFSQRCHAGPLPPSASSPLTPEHFPSAPMHLRPPAPNKGHSMSLAVCHLERSFCPAHSTRVPSVGLVSCIRVFPCPGSVSLVLDSMLKRVMFGFWKFPTCIDLSLFLVLLILG